jgi:hypothetical protein
MKNHLLAILLSATLALGASAVEKPAGEKPEKKAGGKPGGRASMIPDKIEGVSESDLNKVKAAMAKIGGDEAVKAAREHLADLKSRAEFASQAEKKDLRNDFEIAAEDLRKATRAALMKADHSLSKDLLDKVFDAIDEQNKQRMKENSKKKGAPGADKKPEAKTDKDATK